MSRIRKASWFPLMSLLLLAVFLPVQAADCCKLGMLLPSGSDPVPAQPAEVPTGAISEMATDHSCCPKPSEAPAPVRAPASPERDCEGDKGCCLMGIPTVEPALVSTPAAFLLIPALVLFRLPLELPPVAPASSPSVLPADSGPPLYLAHQRLLI